MLEMMFFPEAIEFMAFRRVHKQPQDAFGHNGGHMHVAVQLLDIDLCPKLGDEVLEMMFFYRATKAKFENIHVSEIDCKRGNIYDAVQLLDFDLCP